ncbi:MAG: exported protein of unknown function [Methanothrix sp.]|nr:MAG: exported protein of unknown function [Methanothrix sp.]
MKILILSILSGILLLISSGAGSAVSEAEPIISVCSFLGIGDDNRKRSIDDAAGHPGQKSRGGALCRSGAQLRDQD